MIESLFVFMLALHSPTYGASCTGIFSGTSNVSKLGLSIQMALNSTEYTSYDTLSDRIGEFAKQQQPEPASLVVQQTAALAEALNTKKLHSLQLWLVRQVLDREDLSHDERVDLSCWLSCAYEGNGQIDLAIKLWEKHLKAPESSKEVVMALKIFRVWLRTQKLTNARLINLTYLIQLCLKTSHLFQSPLTKKQIVDLRALVDSLSRYSATRGLSGPYSIWIESLAPRSMIEYENFLNSLVSRFKFQDDWRGAELLATKLKEDYDQVEAYRLLINELVSHDMLIEALETIAAVRAFCPRAWYLDAATSLVKSLIRKRKPPKMQIPFDIRHFIAQPDED